MRLLSILITGLVTGVILMSSAIGAQLTITTAAFNNNGPIPENYTCDGQEDSPALVFSNIPANAKSLVLLCSDPDAPTGSWYHWAIYNMDPKTTELKMNEKPSSGVLAKNSYGKTQYSGPCPPKGSIPHHYIFTLYALDNVLSFPSTPDAQIVEKAIKNHVIQSTKLVGIYKRK